MCRDFFNDDKKDNEKRIIRERSLERETYSQVDFFMTFDESVRPLVYGFLDV